MQTKEKIKRWTKKNSRMLVAIVFMLIAIVVASFIPFNSTKYLFILPIAIGEERLETWPGFLSTFFATIIYMGSIVRNKKEMFKNPINTVMCVLNVLFISCLLNTFINKDFVILNGLNAWSILIIAIALSWVGMRTISGYAWLVLLIGAATQVTKADKAMAGWGAVFLICAFISAGNQIYSGFLVVNTKDLKKEFAEAKDNLSEDIKMSIDTTKDVVKTAKNITSPEKINSIES